MDRILQNTASTISATFSVDGVPTAASGVTVTITRADGTALVSGATPTAAGTGVFNYTLTATQTATLDSLTATWTGTVGGQVQTIKTFVEIAGGFLFTIAQLQTLLPTATVAQINEARLYAETELENAVGFALVPRYCRQTISSQSSTDPLRLKPFLRTIRAATVSTTVLTSTDLAALTFRSGFVYGYPWMAGNGTITVGFEHGMDYPPPGATRAALAIAQDYLGVSQAGIDPRAESIVTEDGTLRLRPSAGQFAALGVNEWVAANRIPAVA